MAKKNAKSKAPRKQSRNAANSEAELSNAIDLSNFEDYPKEAATTRVRFIPPSADVLFARAEIGAKEVIASVTDPHSQGFIDRSTQFIDVGYKFTNGKRTEELSVRLHVKKKRRNVPFMSTCFNGRISTDVLESNFRSATSSSSGDLITSTGNPGEFGTLGMGVVMDRGTSISSRTMFLTCAHVISPTIPTQQSQFAVSDASGNPIGIAYQFSELFFENSNEYDVGIFPALTSIAPEDRGSFDRLPVVPNSINDPTRDDIVNRTRVFKVGARTASTIGVLDSIGSLFAGIPLENGLVATDHFLVRSTPTGTFADEGDSGAIVVSEDGRILGMVRAVDGDSLGKRAVVTRMSKISARFQFNPIR